MRKRMPSSRSEKSRSGTRAALRREDGFTLAELIVTVLIMMILMVGLASMIESGAKSSTASYNLVRMEEAANEALGNMTRQIRVATSFDPACDNGQIMFTGDLNGDGEITQQAFRVVDGALIKDGQPWVEGATDLTFTYYWYDRGARAEEVLVPGSYPGWNEMIHRVEITLEMSGDSLEVTLNRTYYGSVTIMNALR